jgi:hypothetical protein
MTQMTLTPGQLKILKEAIDYHIESFCGEDDQQAYNQAKHLQQFINYKVNQSQQEVTTEQFLDILFEGED